MTTSGCQPGPGRRRPDPLERWPGRLALVQGEPRPARAVPCAATSPCSAPGPRSIRWSRGCSWSASDRGIFEKSFREKGRAIKVLLEHGHDPVVGNKPLGAPSRLEEETTAPPTRCRW